MWTHLRFDNGDRVMVSMAPDEVKVFKMSLLGPTATLATIGMPELRERWGLHTGDLPRRTEVLDKLTSVVVSETSAEDVRQRFAAP
jgi:hypothetical protein